MNFKYLSYPYKNVQSIRLIQASFPNKLPVFSDKYNNTKLKFKTNENEKIITIQEGSYSPQQLTSELNSKLNSDNISVCT